MVCVETLYVIIFLSMYETLGICELLLFNLVSCVLGLGYHEDPQTRSTFMEVLTDILKQVSSLINHVPRINNQI